jgi:hypothetical protein
MASKPEATILEAEGARIGVVTCPICGCAVMLDPRENDAYKQHMAWHKDQAAASSGDSGA